MTDNRKYDIIRVGSFNDGKPAGWLFQKRGSIHPEFEEGGTGEIIKWGGWSLPELVQIYELEKGYTVL